jgi:uncharacterized LabA/DUF88 family protein
MREICPKGDDGDFARHEFDPNWISTMAQSILDDLLHPDERLALFIDGANLYSAARALQIDLDYRRLLVECRQRARLIRAYYYTAIVEDQEVSSLRPLIDWLDYNGYSLVTKPAREYTDQTGRRRYKGNMDVEISVNMMEAASFLDHAILFSGDGDFVSLIEALQRRGVRTTVVSTVRSQPPMVADDLRRAADAFLDLADLVPLIGRPPRSGGGGRGGDYDED